MTSFSGWLQRYRQTHGGPSSGPDTQEIVDWAISQGRFPRDAQQFVARQHGPEMHTSARQRFRREAPAGSVIEDYQGGPQATDETL